jgi:predicted sulfurtransferase
MNSNNDKETRSGDFESAYEPNFGGFTQFQNQYNDSNDSLQRSEHNSVNLGAMITNTNED